MKYGAAITTTTLFTLSMRANKAGCLHLAPALHLHLHLHLLSSALHFLGQ